MKACIDTNGEMNRIEDAPSPIPARFSVTILYCSLLAASSDLHAPG